jgi:LmbE family N-acetylglucosaminyl deacetylase
VAPERGAAALGSALAAVGTTGRVLTIAAHPDDEDTPVLAWLARGRHVETAYLSLTRGDGGQNLIGQELGEALGAIRTQELLAARRLDGARQYFTRAYDFGFSKDADETLRHWPRDTVLGDVVRVVRAFRPQVVVAFFSGTPRDGHGHHQLSGMLAREAYDAAGDTVRFPVAAFGLPWSPAKFYRSARQQPDSATLRVNTGAYDPLLGRSWYELSAESRSQHKSQGFGMLQRKGVVFAHLRREAARVGPVDPRAERSPMDGVDTSWAPHRQQLPAAARPVLDSALAAVAAARGAWRAEAPAPVVAPLARAVAQLRRVQEALEAAHGGPPARLRQLRASVPPRLEGARVAPAAAAAHDAIALTAARAATALQLAAGVAVEATAPRALFPVRDPARTGVNDSLPVTITVFNRGHAPVRLLAARVGPGAPPPAADTTAPWLAPDSSATRSAVAVAFASTTPWWRAEGRVGDWFAAPVDARDEGEREAATAPVARVRVAVDGVPVELDAPVVYRYADPVKGDQQLPVAAVPGITIGLETPVAYIRAGVPVRRAVRVRVQGAYPDSARVLVRLMLPAGLVADSVERWRTLRPGGGAELTFLVRGTLPPGAHPVAAVAYHEGTASMVGYGTVAYDHITPQRLYARAVMTLSAVSVALPARARGTCWAPPMAAPRRCASWTSRWRCWTLPPWAPPTCRATPPSWWGRAPSSRSRRWPPPRRDCWAGPRAAARWCCSTARRTWGASPRPFRTRCNGHVPRRASRGRRRRCRCWPPGIPCSPPPTGWARATGTAGCRSAPPTCPAPSTRTTPRCWPCRIRGRRRSGARC